MTDNYILELDDKIYRLSGNHLETQADISSARGCKFLVSDFPKSIFRVMHVEADIQYAETMVTRALQDEGEFDEPVTIITHWKKAHGKKSTEIFFTAVPSRVYLQYMDMIAAHNNLLIIIPVLSVLSHFIQQISDTDPIAVVFRHGRFADLVIGRKNQIYFATQCVAFDTDETQIASLWENVSRELSMNIQENALTVNRLFLLNWIDAEETPPDILPLDIEPVFLTEKALHHEGILHKTSFPSALEIFPPLEGIAPKNGKLLFYADKLSPFITTFFVLASIFLLWNAHAIQSNSNALTERISSIEKRIDRLNAQVALHAAEPNYQETLTFVDTLFHNRLLPGYKDIVNDISMGLFPAAVVEQLKVEYADRTVQIELSGGIHSDFDSAYKGYQLFLTHLQKRGYEVTHKIFNTNIDTSRFDLVLSRGVQ